MLNRKRQLFCVYRQLLSLLMFYNFFFIISCLIQSLLLIIILAYVLLLTNSIRGFIHLNVSFSSTFIKKNIQDLPVEDRYSIWG